MARRRSGIVYYVTSHGYGHMNRAAAVVMALPPGVPVTIKMSRDLFAAWRRSAHRPCRLVEGVFDTGAVHPPGESSRVDPEATLRAYARRQADALERLAEEAAFLRASGCAAVVSDAAPIPLVAAEQAGVPGILVANFTWAQIFGPYVKQAGGQYAAMLRQMRAQYRRASVYLRAQPALEPHGFPAVRDVGIIARRGRNRRAELARELGVAPAARLVYLYIGRYGQDDVAWDRLRRLAGFEFVSYHACHAPPENLHVVDPARWPPRDLAASVACMVAKAGYGTVSDAMTHRVPLVFPPRFGFSEHRALARGLGRWGGGIPVGTRAFKEFRIRRALEAASAMRPGPPPWPVDGAHRAARAIERFCSRTSIGATGQRDSGPRKNNLTNGPT